MNGSPKDPGIAGIYRVREKTGAGAARDDAAVARGRMAQTLAAAKPGF